MSQQIHWRRGTAVMALTALVAVSAFLVSCAAVTQPYAVRKGIARDYIFSVEPLNNAAVRVWLRSDSLAAYCVTQPDLAAKFTDALQNWNGEVLVTYHSLSPIERQATAFVNAGCGTFTETNASSFELFSVDDLKLVPGRGGPDTGTGR